MLAEFRQSRLRRERPKPDFGGLGVCGLTYDAESKRIDTQTQQRCTELKQRMIADPTNKAMIIESISEQPLLEFASQAMKEDKDVVLAAVQREGTALKHVSPKLRADRAVVVAALKRSPDAIEFVPEGLFKSDKEVGMLAVAGCPAALGYLSNELRADRDVVHAAVSQRGEVLQFASESLRADRSIVLAAVGKRSDEESTEYAHHGEALQFASPALQADRSIVTAAVQQSGRALRFAPPQLRADYDVVLSAVSHNSYSNGGEALQFASDELKGNKVIAEIAVSQWNGAAFEYVSGELKADKEVARIAVSKSYSNFKLLPEELQLDIEIGMKMIKWGRSGVPLLPEVVKADKSVAMAAVASSADNYRYLPDTIKADKDVARKALSANNFQLLPVILRGEKEFAVLGASRCGDAVRHLPEDSILRSDPDVCLAAMSADSWRLDVRDVPQSLRADPAFALAAVTKEPSLLGGMEPNVLEDPAVRQKIAEMEDFFIFKVSTLSGRSCIVVTDRPRPLGAICEEAQSKLGLMGGFGSQPGTLVVGTETMNPEKYPDDLALPRAVVIDAQLVVAPSPAVS